MLMHEALMWFLDFGMLHLWKNSRTNTPTPTVLRDVLFYYTWSLIRWRGIWPFHYWLLESQSCCFSTVTRWSKLFASDKYNATLTIRSYFSLQVWWYCSFDVNMELSLSQRMFQEVTLGSSVPSSGPNGEGLAPELIDYPHPTLKSHRWYKT